jgi:hypothetical protein
MKTIPVFACAAAVAKRSTSAAVRMIRRVIGRSLRATGYFNGDAERRINDLDVARVERWTKMAQQAH